jgi:hypothetical protein
MRALKIYGRGRTVYALSTDDGEEEHYRRFLTRRRKKHFTRPDNAPLSLDCYECTKISSSVKDQYADATIAVEGG